MDAVDLAGDASPPGVTPVVGTSKDPMPPLDPSCRDSPRRDSAVPAASSSPHDTAAKQAAAPLSPRAVSGQGAGPHKLGRDAASRSSDGATSPATATAAGASDKAAKVGGDVKSKSATCRPGRMHDASSSQDRASGSEPEDENGDSEDGCSGYRCCGCGVVVDGRLECPTCAQLVHAGASAGGASKGLHRRSFFCSSACFKKAWPEHKQLMHSPLPARATTPLPTKTPAHTADKHKDKRGGTTGGSAEVIPSSAPGTSSPSSASSKRDAIIADNQPAGVPGGRRAGSKQDGPTSGAKAVDAPTSTSRGVSSAGGNSSASADAAGKAAKKGKGGLPAVGAKGPAGMLDKAVAATAVILAASCVSLKDSEARLRTVSDLVTKGDVTAACIQSEAAVRFARHAFKSAAKAAKLHREQLRDARRAGVPLDSDPDAHAAASTAAELLHDALLFEAEAWEAGYAAQAQKGDVGRALGCLMGQMRALRRLRMPAGMMARALVRAGTMLKISGAAASGYHDTERLCYRQACDFSEAGEDWPGKLQAMMLEADLLLRENKLHEMEALLTSALHVARSHGLRRQAGMLLSEIARLQADTGAGGWDAAKSPPPAGSSSVPPSSLSGGSSTTWTVNGGASSSGQTTASQDATSKGGDPGGGGDAGISGVNGGGDGDGGISNTSASTSVTVIQLLKEALEEYCACGDREGQMTTLLALSRAQVHNKEGEWYLCLP
eukprot:jgi/Mesvir1/12151/Mv00401-RA.3